MDQNIENIVGELIEAVKSTESYQEYKKQQEKVVGHQDVIDKINEIRALNLKIQSINNAELAYDEQDKLEQRFDELSEDQRVFDFMEAENKFIGMYQEIYRHIMEEMQVI